MACGRGVVQIRIEQFSAGEGVIYHWVNYIINFENTRGELLFWDFDSCLDLGDCPQNSDIYRVMGHHC